MVLQIRRNSDLYCFNAYSFPHELTSIVSNNSIAIFFLMVGDNQE